VDTILRNDQPILTFFWIPKTASVSISAALYYAFPFSSHEKYKTKQVCYKPHASINNLSDLEYPALANNRVCVLRHPYERAKSLWQYSVIHIDSYDSDESFEEFLLKRFYEKHMDYKHATFDPNFFYFYAPQWHWAQHCNIYLDFNNLDKDFNNLLKKYVMPGIYNLPRKNVLNSKNSVELKHYHKKIIQKIYADDFEYLGFEY